MNLLFRVLFTEDLGRDAGQGQSDFFGQDTAPGLFEFSADGFVRYGLITGVLVGQESHVTGSLDVVLASDRADTGGVMAVVAGHETEVGAGNDAFDALGKLGDAHAPQGYGVFRGSKEAGSLSDRVGI